MRTRIRGGRPTVLLAAVMLGATVALAAQSGPRVEEAVLLPPRFFVGDRVELRLRFQVPPEVAVTQPELPERAGQSLPGGESTTGESWLRIERVEVRDRRGDGRGGEVQVRVFFVPLAPGEGRLPALNCGELRVPSQEFRTDSVRVREPGPEFRPLRGQLLLPYTRLRLALTGLALVGVPTTLTALGLWALRLLRRLRELHRRRRPAVRVRRALEKLEQGLEKSETKVLFVDLSQVLKRYLADRLGLPTFSSTTAEIDELLLGAGIAGALARKIREVLRTADRAKFSGRSAKRVMAKSSLNRVREVVAQIEELTEAGTAGPGGAAAGGDAENGSAVNGGALGGRVREDGDVDT